MSLKWRGPKSPRIFFCIWGGQLCVSSREPENARAPQGKSILLPQEMLTFLREPPRGQQTPNVSRKWHPHTTSRTTRASGSLRALHGGQSGAQGVVAPQVVLGQIRPGVRGARAEGSDSVCLVKRQREASISELLAEKQQETRTSHLPQRLARPEFPQRGSAVLDFWDLRGGGRVL